MPDGIKISMVDSFPGWDAIAALEQVTIINQAQPADIKGVGTGRVVIVAETTKGDLNKCQKFTSAGEIIAEHGDVDKTIMTLPAFTSLSAIPSNGWEGNLWWAISQRKFAELCVVRADVAIRESNTKIAFTVTRSGTVTSAYTLPAGTLIEGENDDGDTVWVATMSDATFAANATTATVYCRPVTTGVAGEDFGSSYSGLTDVLTATVDSVTYPKTTIHQTGDLSYPYPTGMTMAASAVSHSAFTCDSWATIVNLAYAAAIGTAAAPGGAYSAVDPAGGRDILLSARHWAGGTMNDCAAIRTAMATHVSDSQAAGMACVAPIRPPLDCDKATAIGSSDPGVATNRSKRLPFCFPGVAALLPSFDSETNTNTGLDTWLASILSQSLPEESPAQYHHLIDGRGIAEIMQIESTSGSGLRDLTYGDYSDFKAAGICAPVFSSTNGWSVYSGVTSSLTSGDEQIRVVRFRDFVNSSIAAFIEGYRGRQVKTKEVEAIRLAMQSFFDGLKSEDDADAQRIEDYWFDVESGNTTVTRAKKIYVIKWKVRMLPVMDSFALFSEIGDTVEIPLAA